jgi:hypothetical protein
VGFQSDIDNIVLSKTMFKGLTSAVGIGFSNLSEFLAVTSDIAAATSQAMIVYNTANGNLFYNQNGSQSGFGSGALFANLDGIPALSVTDFSIEA